MTTLSKKQKLIKEKLIPNHVYKAAEAIEVLKQFASTKFNEAVDIAVNLGVDPRKSDQVVRSSTNLPKGTGKVVRVAVFAQGAAAEAAKAEPAAAKEAAKEAKKAEKKEEKKEEMKKEVTGEVKPATDAKAAVVAPHAEKAVDAHSAK